MKYLRKFNSLNSFNGERPFLYALSNILTPTVCGVKNNSSVINEIKYINSEVPNEIPIFVKVAHGGDLTGSNGFDIYVVFPHMNVYVEGTVTLSVTISGTKRIYRIGQPYDSDYTLSYPEFNLADNDDYDLENGHIPWDIYEQGQIVKGSNGNINDMFTSTAYQNMQIEVDMTGKYYDEGANDWFDIPVVVYTEKDL